MYDAGSYLFQIGYGYLNADALFGFSGVEAPGELASFETAAARLAGAEELFAASLRRDPANAHAWLAYAQTLAARGAFEAARAALITSWELAPTTPRLATGRLFLIEALRDLTNTRRRRSTRSAPPTSGCCAATPPSVPRASATRDASGRPGANRRGRPDQAAVGLTMLRKYS